MLDGRTIELVIADDRTDPEDRGRAHHRADPARPGCRDLRAGDQRQPRRHPAEHRALQDATALRHRLRGRRVQPLHHLLQRPARALGRAVHPVSRRGLRRQLLPVRQRLRLAAEDERRDPPRRGRGRRRGGRRRVHAVRRQGLHRDGAQDHRLGRQGPGDHRGRRRCDHLRQAVRRRRRQSGHHDRLLRLQRELPLGLHQGGVRGHPLPAPTSSRPSTGRKPGRSSPRSGIASAPTPWSATRSTPTTC